MSTSLWRLTSTRGEFLLVGILWACAEAFSPFSAHAQTNDNGYVGCFTDQVDRALPVFVGTGYTPSTCKRDAAARGLPYAGVQFRGECWAGDSIRYDRVSDAECNTPCDADSGFWCGGAYRNSIYASGGTDTGYLGCYTDQPDRALPVFVGTGYTPSTCKRDAAARGLPYAGVQFRGECWAGDSIRYDRVSDAECNTLCDADSRFACGGVYRNSLYQSGGGGDRLPAGQRMYPGQSITSGNTRLTYQTDNHLVLYQGASPIWATWHSLNAPTQYFAMQTDCNAVVYEQLQNLFTGEWTTVAGWDSRTNGRGSDCYARVIEGDWFICSGNTRVWSARGGGSCDDGSSCPVTSYANQQQSNESTSSLQFPFRYCSIQPGPLPSYCSYYCAYLGIPLHQAAFDVKVLSGTRTIRTGQPVDSCIGVHPERVVIGDNSGAPTSHCWVLTGRDCVDQYWRNPENPRCQ